MHPDFKQRKKSPCNLILSSLWQITDNVTNFSGFNHKFKAVILYGIWLFDPWKQPPRRSTICTYNTNNFLQCVTSVHAVQHHLCPPGLVKHLMVTTPFGQSVIQRGHIRLGDQPKLWILPSLPAVSGFTLRVWVQKICWPYLTVPEFILYSCLSKPHLSRAALPFR